jgi:hypothetical protein
MRIEFLNAGNVVGPVRIVIFVEVVAADAVPLMLF